MIIFPRVSVLMACLPLVLAACGGERAEDMVASAKKYLEKNDNKAAIIQLKNSLQKSSDLAEARFLLGKAFFKTGDVVPASIELRKALELKYPAEQAVPLLARAMLVMQEHKKVVDQYGTTTFGDKSATADLKTSLAIAYAAQGDKEKSQAALQAAFDAMPDHPSALLFDARLKASQRRFDEAFAAIDKAIASPAEAHEAWFLKGELLQYGKNDTAGAMAAFRKAKELAPDYVPARAGIVALALAQRDVKAAEKEVEEFHKAFPGNLQGKYFDAELAYVHRDPAKGREAVLQLLKVAPNNPKVLQLAGAIEFEANSLVQAEQYLSLALKQASGLDAARRLLAQTHLRTGQPAKALAVLAPLLNQEAPSADVLSQAAEAHLQSGDEKQAEAYLARVAKLRPDDVKTRSALALSRLNDGNMNATVAELQALADHDSGAYADLALASAHMRKGNHDAALKAIESIERKQPKRPFAANLQGRVHLLRKDTAQARRSFERALAIDPVFVPAAISLALLDMGEKNDGAAAKRFESILKTDPKNMQAMMALAGLKVRSGAKPEEVAALLANAIKLNPGEAAPRLALVDFHLGRRDGKAALIAAQDAAAALRDRPDVLDALGRAQAEAGEVNQAVATFGKLAAMQPDSPQAPMRLARVHLVNKDQDAARRSLKQALAVKPDLLPAQQALVGLELAAARPEDAIAVARTVQKQRPSEAIGFLMEAAIDTERNDLSAAANVYTAALQRFGSPAIAAKLHAVLVRAHRDAEAGKLVASWTKTHPNDAVFTTYLGEAALEKKDHAAAERHFREVLRFQPGNALAMNNLAWTLAVQEKPGAVDLAKKATALVPDAPDFLDTLATALAAENQMAQAVDVQKKALALVPGNAMFRLRLAKLYIKAGDRATARSELETLAKLNDKFGAQAEVSALLKTL